MMFQGTVVIFVAVAYCVKAAIADATNLVDPGVAEQRNRAGTGGRLLKKSDPAVAEQRDHAGTERRVKRSKKCTKKGGCVDKYGCRTSAGYEWCEILQECIRPFETECAPPSPVGFEKGMTTEINGLWMGDEIYKYEGDILNYCGSAFFQSSTANDKHYLSWLETYLPGDGIDTCEDVGVSPKTGGVNNPNFYTIGWDNFLLNVGYKKCLTEVECTYDVTTSDGWGDYEVIAKACGAHLKANMLDDIYDCELYQINRVKDSNGTELDVAILTYGDAWTGGFANFTCPNKPTFDVTELVADPLATGTTRYVFQTGYAPGTPANLTDWDCTV